MPRIARSVVVDAFGAPATFSLRTNDPGAPGRGQVRLRIRAAGVSFVDVLVAEGLYQLRPPLPFVPGSEFAGVIEAVGEGVDPARVGRRVMAGGFGAAFGEAAVLRSDHAVDIPDEMDFETAAIFRVSYATMYHALVQRAALAPGESVVVLGAGGAVGHAAVEVATALGARVVASASTPEKRDLARRGGAAATIDSRSATWRDDLRAANMGKPVDVAVDPVGGDATEPAFRSLAWGGRHLVIGFASGAIARVPANLALLKGASLVGVDIRQFGEYEPDLAARNLQVLLAWFRAGKLRPAVAKCYPLESFAEAMTVAKSGKHAGRIVLTMAD